MDSVSVIIPTYNRANTILKAVKSALNQTYNVHEIIICDDGSTDNTYDLISAIDDARIYWLPCGRNGRPARPRNLGIAKATGEWVAFLDSDDEWLPKKIEKQMYAANEKQVAAVCSNAFRVINEKKSNQLLLSNQKEYISFSDLCKVNSVICSSAVVKKEVLNYTGYFPEDQLLIALEDYALWLRIATLSKFVYIFEPLLYYQDNPKDSIREINKKSIWDQNVLVFNDFLAWAERNPISQNIIVMRDISFER